MGDESPKSKVKFLCSYGGKILPRHSDGVLKYVGGETRVICVPRDITFSEMMKKVNDMVDGEVILKYQVIPEDLDALVSVRTEEDVKHMIEEQVRHENSGAPLLRAFLFPSKQQLQTQTQVPPCEPYFLEQRYIDAINGIIRVTSPSPSVSPSPRPAAFSACSSPKSTSPDAHTTAESPSFIRVSNSMHKVRSSPSLTNLSQQQQQQQHDHITTISHHYNHHYHNPVAAAAAAYPSSSCRTPPIMADTRGCAGGYNYYYPAATRPHKGYFYQEESLVPPNGHYMFERVNSVPRSRSPLKSIWD